ncbi:T9SS type A sorting domain-containing protein [Hymenobacter gummosus]|uniref:T9SS type A sorting domain-containing protein n=1 Tax=Hymenobacter gummosus TaxID=1776032 RepID=A0A431U5B8_9BACT|nr:T9SS type A sorting domain-containing protein [Hymenobacter gummosus]RTQ50822.1 T9SS type A sorting domain-containing protein [Hymenobacter gummosus]
MTHSLPSSGWRKWLTGRAAQLLITGAIAGLPTYAVHAQTGNSVTITTANTVVNEYTALTANAAAGATSLTVASNNLNANGRFGSTALGAGDVVLIIQMQGADMDVTNTSAYGTITNYNNAGRYEVAQVLSVSGSNTINLSCGLKYNYSAAGRTQVVRLARYSSLTVNSGASITAQAWNGTTGGVMAATVSGNTVLNGSINVNALGFRGGAIDNESDEAGLSITDYRGTSPLVGGEKGESIVGDQQVYDGGLGRYGRGAPANGGGGGNSHNAAGGGGANAGTGTWTGLGNPNRGASNAYDAAWNLESAGFATRTSSGGGRGGYSYASSNADALAQGPGNTAWGGNRRQNLGGFGGRPLDTRARVFLGGGGGAGDGNNGGATSGGNGGGLVFLLTEGTLSGTGSVQAVGGSGARPGFTTSSGQDAGGGGGGGGTIVLNVKGTISGITASAAGGAGNSQSTTGTESEGPGGGGGGGLLLFTNSGTGFNGFAPGGANGTTNSPSLTEFPPNGATAGGGGEVRTFLFNPQCAEADVTTTLAPTSNPTLAGQSGGFTVTFRNTSQTTGANDVVGTVTLPTGLSNVSVSNGGVYNSATGVVSYDGLTSLTPDQTFSSTISFLTPAVASVSASSAVSTTTGQGANTNPDAATASFAVTPVADVTTTISGPNGQPRNVDSNVYTATFTNNGPSTAQSVTQRVVLPPGVSAVTIPQGATTSTQGNGGNAVTTINFGTATSLAAGASNSFNFTFRTPNQAGSINLQSTTGTTTTQAPGGGGGTAPDTYTFAVNITNTALDLSTSVVAQNGTVAGGLPAQFTVTFTNNSGTAATNTVREVQLPANLPGVALPTGWSYNSSTGLVTYNTPGFTLAANSSTTLVIDFTAPGTGPVTATSTVNSDAADTNQANNSASASINVTPSADVQATLSGPTTLAALSTLTYTATVRNNGPLTATSVATTVQLPRALFEVTGGTYDANSGILTLPTLSNLESGVSQTFPITFRLPNNNQTVSGRIVSTSTSTDAVPANNNGTASTATVTTLVTLPTGNCSGTTAGNAAATQGLYAEYFKNYHGDNLNFFNNRTADVTRTEGAVNFPTDDSWGDIFAALANGSATNPDQYSARMQGIITITAGGSYTFTLNSDDGSYLWLGNGARETPLSISRAIINNGGGHAPRPISATLTLNPGTYPLFIVYGEGGGGNVMTLSYSGPDTGDNLVLVPQSVLCATRVSSAPLPITLTRFDAKPAGLDAQLSWATAQEINNEYFAVERSADGVRFEPVGRVQGAGNSSVARQYGFTDKAAARLGRTVYYRLRQVDTDGTFSYSAVQPVRFGDVAEAVLYPNPATEQLTVRLPFDADALTELVVYSTLGQQVSRQPVDGRASANLDVRRLPAGTYLLRLHTASGKVLTRRFVKQ